MERKQTEMEAKTDLFHSLSGSTSTVRTAEAREGGRDPPYRLLFPYFPGAPPPTELSLFRKANR